MPRGFPSERPSENTLTINITHEILSQAERVFPRVVATSPTRIKESKYGYDVAMDWSWAKSFVLQYKRPLQETGRIQHFKECNGYRGGDNYVKFRVDSGQWETLRDLYHPDEAFLVVPVVRDRKDMPGNLHSDTLFIDVHGIQSKNPTLLYIPEDHISTYRSISLSPPIFVRGEFETTEIDPKYVSYWDALWRGLLTCEIGRPIRVADDVLYAGQDEASIKPRKTQVVVVGGDNLPQSIQQSWLDSQ